MDFSYYIMDEETYVGTVLPNPIHSNFSMALDFLSFRKKLLRAGFPLPADAASV